MYNEEFQRFRTDRRNKITIMDTIIRNGEDLKSGEKDVLLRGFIVLIYAFWEGNYKKIQNIFFDVLKNKKLKELPHKIKNKVIIDLATTSNEKNKKIVEISDYNQIISINTKINESLDKELTYYSQCENLKHHFRKNSNNPSYEILDEMLSKYNISLRKIISSLIEDGSIGENFKERLEFIIKSRNDIAHGAEIESEYEELIISRFINKENPSIIDVSDFLNETTFYIDLLYNEILNEFFNTYMHMEEKMI